MDNRYNSIRNENLTKLLKDIYIQNSKLKL